MHVPEGTVTVSEAARRLGRSLEQVRRYLRDGRLPGTRVGQQWFIPETALSVRAPPPGADLRALIRRIERRRAAILAQRGSCLEIDGVALLRQDREEH